MPRKQRITKEMILAKAFEVFCQEGMDAITARSVAKAMNCSTQPIFSYYDNMEDLKETLERKAKAQFAQAIHEGDGDSLVDRGCAYVRFAAGQPQVYLHLSRMDDLRLPFEGEAACGAAQAQLSMYVLGLAMACACGMVNEGEEQLRERIADVHSALLRAQ